MATVAVFGGSFNPPHVSHVLAVVYVLSTMDVDQVLVVPAFDHPLGKRLEKFEHRLAMCELAFADIKRVNISLVEQEMGGESRTLYTLQRLKRDHPDWNLRLVIGSDIIAEKNSWYAWDEVVALAPPIVLGRVGHPSPEAPVAVLPEVASRDIRSLLRERKSVTGMVPSSVARYISEKSLYAL